MSTGALPGFRDFYPEQFAERAWLFDRWRDVARRFGFVEYDGPPLEPLDLYTRKSGDEIVGQLYNFEDKGGRQVALRPEMTPTVARMVAARANALRKPVRWFSIPQLFRYERQQKGRLREHFQLNVDIFGESDVAADAELLAVACEIMRACGLGPDEVVARVSDRRLLTAIVRGLGVRDEQVPAVFAAVDKIDRDPWPALVERMGAAGVAASSGERLLELVKASDFAALRAEFASDGVATEALDRFDAYRALLAAHGVEEYLRLDLGIVRGLAYYTGIVFELFDAKGEFRAVCGGGRYDNLLADLAGTGMPALGFGMGDVVLSELLRSRGRMPGGARRLDFWVVGNDGVTPLDVVGAAASLRRLGFSADYVLNTARLTTQKAGAQLSAASKSGAEYALLLLAGGKGEIRELRSKEPQREMNPARLLEARDVDDYLRTTPAEGDGGADHDALAMILRSRRPPYEGVSDRP